MDPLHALLIFGTGLAVGWINNLAGAAGALGLIAFDYWLGMDTTSANGSIRLSALAIGVSGLIGFFSKGQRTPGRMWAYSALTIPGAVLGSMMVREGFEPLFNLTLAVLLSIVLWQQLGNKHGGRSDDKKDQPTPGWMMFLLFSWLGLHMGFIQVGTGLVSIFVLSMVHSRDLVQVNAAKMVLIIVAALTSNVTLAAAEKIEWGPASALAAGAGIGSFLASRWSVNKGHRAVRVVVIGICVVTLGWLSSKLFV